MSIMSFIKTLQKDYRVAAFFPSTRFAAQRIAGEVCSECKLIIEYGPGDGVVTKELLKAMPLDCRLVAIESNADFVGELEKITDPRLKVVFGDVVQISKNLSSFGEVDMIVSGIPFSFFNPQMREEIIRDSYDALRPGGRILLYQVSLLMLPCLKKQCGKSTRWFLEPRNVPPYFIMIGEK